MCIYISATDGIVAVPFASETISLRKDRSSRATIDALVRNDGEMPITSLLVVYPRPLVHVDAQGGVSLGIRASFDDRTDALLTRNDPTNLILDCIAEIQTSGTESAFTLEIRENSSGVHPPQSHKGEINGGVTTMPWEAINASEWTVLSQMGFSIFECQLTQPIPPGSSRWFRWYAKVPRVTINTRTKGGYIADVILNRLKHDYQIFGPSIVLDRLLTATETFILRAMHQEPDSLPALVTAAQDLRTALLSSLAKNRTNFGTWRISVFPGFFRELLSPSLSGDIAFVGQVHTRLPWAKETQERCYQWVSSDGVEPTQGHRGRFHLSFSVEHPNRFVRILPWLGGASAILALSKWILSFFQTPTGNP